MIVWLYWIYIKLYQLLVSCFKQHTSYHYITRQGDQVSVITSDVLYRLIVQHNYQGKLYKIVPLHNEDTFEIPSFTWIGMSIYVNEKSYVISPKEFLFVSNILFTREFNLWLCKHYLKIQPSEKIVTTIIDKHIEMYTVNYPIEIKETTFEKLI